MKHSRDPYDFDDKSMFFMHSSHFSSNPEPRKSNIKLKMKLVKQRDGNDDRQQLNN